MVLPFVEAIIVNRKGEVLIGKTVYSKRKPYPGLWDLPGGKMEENETPEQCIKREIKEELSYKVISLKFVGFYHHSGKNFRKDYNGTIPSLGLCFAARVKGSLLPTEQENVHYASTRELRKLKKTPWTEYFLKIYK